MRWIVAALAAGVFCLGVSLTPEVEQRWFVDETFLYERGSALSREYLQAHAPELAQAALNQAVLTLEVMVSEGWVDAKLNKKKAKLGLNTPDEGGMIHLNRDKRVPPA